MTTELSRESAAILIDSEHLANLLREARKSLGPSSLRDRIDAAVTDRELSCPNCDHYWWNHNADGPCAVRESFPDACSCTGDIGRRDAILRAVRAVWERLAAYRIRLVHALVLVAAFVIGLVLR